MSRRSVWKAKGASRRQDDEIARDLDDAPLVSGIEARLAELTDPELFGNEAGDDEDPEVLAGYFLDKAAFKPFYSDSQRLQFVRSRKGIGKSSLLKRTYYERRRQKEAGLCIYVKASDLIALQDVRGETPDEMIYGWQQRICTLVNREMGSILNVGFTDDAISLIESSELAGFRGRNLISALFDRLSVKMPGVDIGRSRIEIADQQRLLQRFLDKTKSVDVWIFIDDVDATFVNTESERLKVGTFFSACRNLVTSISGLYIRAAVRTDVWSVIAQYDEALDKCEQYMLDLAWSTEETGRILENKIYSFFSRRYPHHKPYALRRADLERHEIRKWIFKEPFPWSGRHLESFRPIHILSGGRPRWAAQLCKMAARDASAKSATRISIGHIKAILRNYGTLRISDLYKEHRHQCESLQAIIESFSGGRKRYTTTELLDHIGEKIVVRGGIPKIDGVSSARGSLSIANFLFRCGFICARNEDDSAGLGFVRYEERPNLLSSDLNLDDGMDWEIHPSYREILKIESGSSFGDG
ncbi:MULTISPECIES: P-loop ATPase, Sll1717 family [unclassified Stenotrophomonas]|uniref:P-loop ATPase, Sll1717 family n=1 Tax=unclassified Stenotrophomonas TaxID=196198 RepID=UPI003467D30E